MTTSYLRYLEELEDADAGMSPEDWQTEMELANLDKGDLEWSTTSRAFAFCLYGSEQAPCSAPLAVLEKEGIEIHLARAALLK